METNPHEFFKTIQDRWNWDKYIQQVDSIELSDVDRQKAKDSFTYLRGILGEGFLRRADQEPNPMFLWYFRNAAPPARLALIRLVAALRALEGTKNFRSALRDIKRRLTRQEDFERLGEKLSMVQIAHKFLIGGFDIEFDPIVNVADVAGRTALKKPDLRIVDHENGQEIIVEVSRMKASDHQQLISRTFQVIWSVLIDQGMHGDPESFKDITKSRHILPYTVIHRGIEDEELKGIVEQIQKLVADARNGVEFGELIIPGTIEIGIASYDSHELAKRWATDRGLKENDLVVGASIQSDEIARAKRKLRTELEQIPPDTPGIVMLEAKDNLLFFVYDLAALAIYLGEEVKRYPNILWAIFFHNFDIGGSESYSRPIGPHTFVNQVRSDGSTEQMLIIRNIECSTLLPSSTIQKLESAFATR
jgi:hypothetical protein